MPTVKEIDPVKASQSKKALTSETDTLLSFELPDVTQTATDFINDEPVQSGTDAGENSLAFEVNENDESEKYRGTPDKRGNPYDPMIHAFPPEMTGKLQKWKKKPKSKVDEGITKDGVKSNTAYRAEADKFASLYAQMHMIPFGQDGALKDKSELAPLIDDLERYFMENGHTQISAGWSVGLSSLLYSLNVCQREPNMKKLKRWFSGAWDRIKGMFGKKEKLPTSDKFDKYRTQAESSAPVKNSEQQKYPEAGGGF